MATLKLAAICGLLVLLMVQGIQAQPPVVDSAPAFTQMVLDMNAFQPLGMSTQMIDKWFVNHEGGVLVCSNNYQGLSESRTYAYSRINNKPNDTNVVYVYQQIVQVMMYDNTIYKNWAIVREETLLTGGTSTTPNYDALVRWRVTATLIATNAVVTKFLWTKHNPWGCGAGCFRNWTIAFICPSNGSKQPATNLSAGVGGLRYNDFNSTGGLALDTSPTAYAIAVVRALEKAVNTQNLPLFHRQFHNVTGYRITQWAVNGSYRGNPRYTGPTTFAIGLGSATNAVIIRQEFNFNFTALGFASQKMEHIPGLQLTRVTFDQYFLMKQTLSYAVGDPRPPVVVYYWIKIYNDGKANCGCVTCSTPPGIPVPSCRNPEASNWRIVTHLLIDGPPPATFFRAS